MAKAMMWYAMSLVFVAWDGKGHGGHATWHVML
ncbi:uncharacterized protein G2W53_013642 [Senna tora]|uniref:Uncharacterized protein n=1 Tax=Senna tora TaxID=362788 RepID=A0A834U029_9FABA|nr:uncharacterized protein G2W53_013642 [Senna tora]